MSLPCEYRKIVEARLAPGSDRGLAPLPANLRQHILRAREVAMELARRHGLDEERVWLAISGHDIARVTPPKRLLAEARRLGLTIGPVEEALPLLLHGPVAAETLRRDGLDDGEVYDAVFWHSTAHPSLGPVGLAVFLADKLDPEKAYRYSYLAELKALALESLERAALDFLEREMASLLREGKPVHTASLEARNALLMRLKPLS
ncbi:MAG: bis(5'-nucleosyl)-tetraphosphatase (symmetrical) YqeK [Chloroflexota bacterium]|nr:bis(5'-nucleosyl)-tetraphosphatase (symmetrical) YqeK [Chloroflexota bacterium]